MQGHQSIGTREPVFSLCFTMGPRIVLLMKHIHPTLLSSGIQSSLLCCTSSATHPIRYMKIDTVHRRACVSHPPSLSPPFLPAPRCERVGSPSRVCVREASGQNARFFENPHRVFLLLGSFSPNQNRISCFLALDGGEIDAERRAERRKKS
jgi:hypothetical protein